MVSHITVKIDFGCWRKEVSIICTLIIYYDDQIKKDEMGGACSTYGKDDKFIRSFSRKPEGKSQLGKPKCRREVNCKMELKQYDMRVYWINLAQDRD
jgi:hypothetical protein